MKTGSAVSAGWVSMLVLTVSAGAGLYGDPPGEMHAWSVHDANRPRPPVVTPGEKPCNPPSDAVVLFDGSNLDAWVSTKEGTPPAPWKLVDGAMEVVPGSGGIQTKQAFGDCQLHIEWRSPDVIEGTAQGRGNSGVFPMSKYEIQVLDSYENDAYPDGQAGSVYAENPPMVNACRKPGEWQTYDIVFHQPRWEGDTLARPGTVTVFHNGVLVQDNWHLEGVSTHRARKAPQQHPEKMPLMLQDHKNPVRFRNIWIREIPSPEGDSTTGPFRKPEHILAQRKATAGLLRMEGDAKLKDGDKPGGMRKWMEALVYVDDEPTLAKVRELAAAYVAEIEALDGAGTEARKDEIVGALNDMNHLAKHGFIPEDEPSLAKLRQIAASRGLIKKKK